MVNRWFVESQTEILVLTNFISLVVFNYLPPCLSFWLFILLFKCMPVIIFSNAFIILFQETPLKYAETKYLV